MRQIRFPVVLLALAASACAPGVDRGAYLNTLVGQPETELVRQLGVPSRTYDTGGRRFVAYSERRADIYGGGPFIGGGFGRFGYYGGGYGLYGAFPATVVERGCETTFELAEGRVVSWSLRGNACG